MSEEKSFYEALEKRWTEERKKNLRHITYIIGDEEREGYVEIDDFEAKFIPIRDDELCGSAVRYVNSDFIREYTLRHLAEKEQENWETTVVYESQSGNVV